MKIICDLIERKDQWHFVTTNLIHILMQTVTLHCCDFVGKCLDSIIVVKSQMVSIKILIKTKLTKNTCPAEPCMNVTGKV